MHHTSTFNHKMTLYEGVEEFWKHEKEKGGKWGRKGEVKKEATEWENKGG